MRAWPIAFMLALASGAAACSLIVGDVEDLKGPGDAAVPVGPPRDAQPDTDTRVDGEAGPSSLEVDLIAHWPFDEDAGIIARDTLGLNDGVFSGNVQRIAGPSSPALGFDGDMARVYMGTDFKDNRSLDVGDTMTWSAWINLQTTTYDEYVYSHGYRFSVRLNARRPQFLATKYAIANQEIPEGAWHHIAVTFDHGVVAWFIDGTQVDSTSTYVSGDLLGDVYGTAAVGCSPDGTSGALGGIDDVRLWRRVLEAPEIALLAK